MQATPSLGRTPDATVEQEAWTQGYDACLQSVRQRLAEVDRHLEVITGNVVTYDQARTIKQVVHNAFTDLGFPFHTEERIS